MSKLLGSIITADKTVSFVYNGTAYAVPVNHPNYLRIRKAVESKDESVLDDVGNLLNTTKAVAQAVSQSTSKAVQSRVVVKGDGTVLVDGEPLHNSLAERVADLQAEGSSIEPFVKFLENLMENPSASSVNELYDFLSHRNMPFTDDGCFLAYKSVRSDYLDKYSGKFDNTVGKTVSVPRNKVDDNRENECSYGLHVGALAYSGPNGWYHNSSDKVVICKVNPRDVVSVPKDHNAQKVRVCAYEVVADYNEPLKDGLYSSSGYKVDSYVDTEVDDSVDVYDLEEGDVVTFDYNGEERHGQVTKIHEDSNNEYTHVTCMLLWPEVHLGEHRKFTVSSMSNIQYST